MSPGSWGLWWCSLYQAAVGAAWSARARRAARCESLILTISAAAVLGIVSVNLLPAGPCRLAFAAFLVLAAVRLLMVSRWSASDSAEPARLESMARGT